LATKIFVTLPVKDPKNSLRFYEAIGFKNNPQFSDETAASIVISETIHVMLGTHAKLKELTTREIADPTKACHTLLSLSCESRSAVVDLMAKALAAGGSQAHEPEDYGFMYQHGFYDLDGHGWGLFWMEPAAVQ
jgi:uncharacterized protein